MGSHWLATERRALQAEAAQKEAALSILKGQVHPHFLFNTLNNLYAMAMAGHPGTAKGLLQLSEMMRYITDEVSTEKVLVVKELQCLHNYIQLQQLRLGKQYNLSFECQHSAPLAQIAPLILLPLVENVFKHGISKQQSGKLSIILICKSEGLLQLTTSNPKQTQTSMEQRSGVGLANTLQRLQLLYPHRHQLEIRETSDRYEVFLKIQLT
ncbi:sensor histidine kinase [Phnomibacter ginsenosidimutans]|nr:histidine kinase [Phnomibacter ginsenosidimutans]